MRWIGASTLFLTPSNGFLRVARLAPLAIAMVVLAACSSTDKDDLTLDETPADVLYNQGLASMNNGKSTEALKKFEDIDRTHPYSEASKKAILMQTYTQFRRGSYTDAIQAGKRFLTLYPGSPDAAYAQYLIAESYYGQIQDVARDQDVANSAVDAYQDLIQRYPQSEYVTDAKRKLTMARDQLAGKEMEIGRYYLAKKQYIAAINRFKTVVQTYQTTRHIEEALARLTECYLAMGIVPEAQTAAAVLGHNYPDSPWYKDSYSLLKNGGYEPQVTESSWMAKALKGIKII